MSQRKAACNSLVNTGVVPNLKLAINSFARQDLFPDTSMTSGKFPDISPTPVKLSYISKFSRQVGHPA